MVFAQSSTLISYTHEYNNACKPSFCVRAFRNSGLAFVGVISRIGAVSAPFVVELKRIHPTLPFGLMGGLAIIAALLCLFLPETRGVPTVEVYEDNNGTFLSYIWQRRICLRVSHFFCFVIYFMCLNF